MRRGPLSEGSFSGPSLRWSSSRPSSPWWSSGRPGPGEDVEGSLCRGSPTTGGILSSSAG
eukprot:1951669-Lingulodinium_polyedra.AAC.1